MVLLVILNAPMPDPAIRNQKKVIAFLKGAYHLPADASTVEHVVLGNGLVLISNQRRIDIGYMFTAHIHGTTFVIEAQPVKAGTTGLFSFFRDDKGAIRFERYMGKPATAHSPLWSPTPVAQ